MIGEIQRALYGVPSNNFVDFLVSFIFFFFDESNSCSNLIFIKKSGIKGACSIRERKILWKTISRRFRKSTTLKWIQILRIDIVIHCYFIGFIGFYKYDAIWVEFKIRVGKLINKREFNLVFLLSILIDLSFNLFMRFYFAEWCYTIFKYIFMYNVLIIKHERFFYIFVYEFIGESIMFYHYSPNILVR